MTLGEYVFKLVQGKKIGSEEWEALLGLYGRDRLEQAYKRFVYGEGKPEESKEKPDGAGK